MEFLRKLGLDKWIRPRRQTGGGDIDRYRLTANQLWQSAERMKQRGMTRTESSMVGHVIGVARRQANVTIEELAAKSGLSVDDVVDLNLGAFPLHKAVTLIEKLKPHIHINESHFKRAMLEDSKKEEQY